jgi:5S rRNA maturation endonuclease (ribonuclease M5)
MARYNGDERITKEGSAQVEFILSELRDNDIRNEVKGEHVWVSCPFHGNGTETTASRRINLSDPRYPTGESFCFACSEGKVKSWNALAAARGLAPMDNGGGERNENWLRIPSEAEFYGTRSAGEVLRLYKRPKGSWRNIGARMMERMETRLIQSKDGTRVYFPVKVGGIVVGHCDACPTGESKDKYLLSGPWSNSVMYPYDYVSLMLRSGSYRYVVIVEGLRDALTLIQRGVPALCMWGTGAWTREKTKAIRALGAMVVIATDDDAAGDGARRKLREVLTDLDPVDLEFHNGGDPGKLKRHEVDKIKTMLERTARTRGFVNRRAA